LGLQSNLLSGLGDRDDQIKRLNQLNSLSSSSQPPQPTTSSLQVQQQGDDINLGRGYNSTTRGDGETAGGGGF